MFNELIEWEIPETTVTTLPTAHDITAVTKNDRLLGYTKSEIDHAGVLEIDNGTVHEYALERASGHRLFLGDLLPMRNRFNIQKGNRFFINSLFGIIYFEPEKNFALLIEINSPVSGTNFPANFDQQQYTNTEGFARFGGDGLFYDHQGRIYRGGQTSSGSSFTNSDSAIMRWERATTYSRYVTVWRLHSRFNGHPYRYWEDQNRRIWFTMYQDSSTVAGHSFGFLNPSSNGIRGWTFASTGPVVLGGNRDMGGIVGDDDKEIVWFSWPRFSRIFKFQNMIPPFTASTNIEVYFHPDNGIPDPEFGDPHDLVRISEKEIVFSNDDKNYVGVMEPSAPPDEMQTANSHPRTWKPFMYQVRYERLAVNKVSEREVTLKDTSVSQEMDMNPPFIRWPTPGTSHHPVYDDGKLYFVKPARTLSVLQ